ncbi:MAG: transcriptional regulator NrdR [Bacteriovoracaceae bacterium]
MNCPYCNQLETKVTDSRHDPLNNTIRRRRKCDDCGKRFTTHEYIQFEMPVIIKNDGRREEYSRLKIFNGIQKACQKRAVSIDQIDSVIEKIEKAIIELNEKEVSSSTIGKHVVLGLRKLDPVAYVRFASVYKTFRDVDEFVNNLKEDDGGEDERREQQTN